MVQCGNCLTENDVARSTCKICSAKLPMNEGYNCPSCKALMGPYVKKCRYCGTQMSRAFKRNTQNKKSIPVSKSVGNPTPPQPSYRYVPEPRDDKSERETSFVMILILILCAAGIYILFFSS
jgi:predicted nucleic acid-binding Zn ribbon protein